MRFRISAYQKDRPAVAEAVQPLFSEPSTVDAHGFVVFTGAADPADVEKLALSAGAHVVYPEPDLPAEPVVVDDSAGAPTEAEEVATVAETVEPAAVEPAEAPEAPAEPAEPFCARFATSDEGIAFTRAAAGRVTFSEPPTSWEDGQFCVHGSGPPSVVQSLLPPVEAPVRGKRRRG